jgi:hypothetical protein
MKIIDYFTKQHDLSKLFKFSRNQSVSDGEVSIKYCLFESKSDALLAGIENSTRIIDDQIAENHQFSYPIFIPINSTQKTNDFIILLHGLNERNWDKYLSWAQFLASETGKAVILFPIAFHMNRAPEWWSDPRLNRDLLVKRKETGDNTAALCFANVALSKRLSDDPARFYWSGRQTIIDIVSLMQQIRAGSHLYIDKDAKASIFSYSIGTFLAEIMLMANPDKLFDNTKLFMFCGGSTFTNMYGTSKMIMDKQAYENLFNFFSQNWIEQSQKAVSDGKIQDDAILKAFNDMILPDYHRSERMRFFTQKEKLIKGISLKRDLVIPYQGVEACMGTELAGACFSLLDFPYEYSHEVPFPVSGKTDPAVVNEAFLTVFNQAAQFLA